MCNKLAYCEKDSGRLVPTGHFFARASFMAVIYDASSTRARPFGALRAVSLSNRRPIFRTPETAILSQAAGCD
ncbi:MAG: hypothetical protein P4L33_08160 [Capsulimonadaceae bacterium]|nr:hypothetical protein [Capsulimonadaceae bacterium]